MRERIVEVATAHFVERGYTAVSMREIAADCGITKAALYYHFDGKAELLNEVFTDYLQQLGEVVAASASADGLTDSQTRLRALVAGMFALPAQRRAILRLAMQDVRQLPADQQAKFAKAYRDDFLDPLARLFADGIASGELIQVDPDFCVKLLLGLLYPFFAPSGPGADGQDTAEVNTLLDVLFQGLATR
jgi:AcrR family transcriptional regulator